MKIAPDDFAAPTIAADSARVQDFLAAQVKKIHDDFESRSMWVQAREHYFNRRYCNEWRNPTMPWPGSSNIVLPLIDKECDELKPQYVNMIATARPPVTCTAALPEWQKNAPNNELLFDWLVNYGSPRFIEETTLAVDDCLETGRGILKSYWLYETRTTPTFLTSDRLPTELRRLVVTQRDERHANSLRADPNGVASGAILLTRQEFDRHRDVVRLVVMKVFDLHDDEPRDAKAIDEVIAWFRAGARGPLRFESRDILTNVPAIRAVSPLDLVVPQNATDDPENHERITEVMFFTKSDLKALALDHKLDRKAVDALFERDLKRGGGESARAPGRINSQRQMVDQSANFREGVGGQAGDDLYEVWKVCTRYSPTENGAEKKVVALLPADCPDVPLQVKAHTRASGSWGYHTFSFEHNKRRWYAARGVPEKIDDLDAEMTAQHRAKLNRMAIVNTPTFKVSQRNAQNGFQWWPGQQLVTNNPANDWIPIVHQPLDVSFDNEVQYLRTWVESLLGHPDYGLTGNSSLTEARTATEIQSINAVSRQALSMRGLLFKRCYDGIWKEFFNLWHEHGPDEVSISVMGGTAPIRVTKEQLQGQFLLQCTGTIGANDPVAEAQKAQGVLGILAEIQPMLGERYALDMGEAVINWLEKYDIRLLKRVIRERSQEEIEALRQQQQQALAQQRNQELAMASAGQKPPTQPAGAAGKKPQQQLPPRLAMAAMGGAK